MNLYRLMGIEEFIKMNSGMDMKSEYGKFVNAKTNSEGFCFIGENVTIDDLNGDIKSISYQNAIEKIFGIMGSYTGAILVEFEVVDGLDINERLW